MGVKRKSERLTYSFWKHDTLYLLHLRLKLPVTTGNRHSRQKSTILPLVSNTVYYSHKEMLTIYPRVSSSFYPSTRTGRTLSSRSVPMNKPDKPLYTPTRRDTSPILWHQVLFGFVLDRVYRARIKIIHIRMTMYNEMLHVHVECE